ncbi:hypothetical protein M407DRAFT_29316 [Tulasnella calospora MUT 4182]|uniref:chitin synthase n=1 Tax=Tulasnella calospora MUT 4182 TaxID=1051891 RepID=A0A0C3LHY7_9AGAM|nr:hypothetical protein M407DRAFT_29316 [Tulasnella calospora MUT 4182]
MASSNKDATAVHDLISLIQAQGATTVYPTDDAILSLLHARFRFDLPYTRIASTSLIVVNPLKSLANTNDASAADYEEKTYRDLTDSEHNLQPHLYELASRVYLLMRRTSQSQSVVFRGITGSGKSHSARLLTNQLLRLSSHSKKDGRVADQIKSFITVLESFGNAKTFHNPSASRYHRYFELQFSERGRIHGAKALCYGLDKSRLVRLSQEERSFHVFYQFLAGAMPEERDLYQLEDPSEYALLASSGCYRLPAGPFSDDSMAMDELRAAMKILGFKPKVMSAIFNLVHAILLLGNLRFMDSGVNEQSAYLLNPEVLARVAHFLAVSQEDLEQAIVNKTNYVRKDVYTVFLNADGCKVQVNQLASDLYAILFAFVVDMANTKVDVSTQKGSVASQIVLLDNPGFQSRGTNNSIGSLAPQPLVAAQGQNIFNEFLVNFTNEMVHSYVIRNVFEDGIGYNSQITGDGITLPAVETMDNSACVEILRGAQLADRSQRKPGGILGIMGKAASASRQGKSTSDRKDEDMLAEITATCAGHSSFVANPPQSTSRTLFAINHYSGPCTYDVRGFVEKDVDLLDSAFVQLLRRSTDGFVSRLVSGPSMATEVHPKDATTVVQAQVSSRILREPTSIPNALPEPEDAPMLDHSKIYPVTTQVNFDNTRLLRHLDGTSMWTVSCIRPNDSGLPNSFDKRRVKSQIRSLLLPDHVARRKVEYVADYDHDEFCNRYNLEGAGEIAAERIRAFTRPLGWLTEGVDYAIGHRRIFLGYAAWKAIDDGLRADEKDERLAAKEEEAASAVDHASVRGHDTARSRDWSGGAGDLEGMDDLAPRGHGGRASGYMDANAPVYSPGTLQTPVNGGYPDTPTNPFRHHADPSMENGWGDRGSAWDKDGGGMDKEPLDPASKEGGFEVKEATAVEEVPTTAARKWWLRFVWAMTFWIPNFLLSSVGRMKRPDIQLAWREKLTICLIIFWMCGIVLFVTIFLGQVMCPQFTKAWTLNELKAHTADDDRWVAVYGVVYDITKFWRGNHGTSTWVSDAATYSELAGTDVTAYFPIPFTVACAGLVTDDYLALEPLNATAFPRAVHTSGPAQGDLTTDLTDLHWFQDYFLPKMKDFRKGPVVWDPKYILDVGQATDSQVKWAVWNGGIYDLSDYFNTITLLGNNDRTAFLDSSISDFFTQQPGQDISANLNAALANMAPEKAAQNKACLQNAFFRGITDFRKTPVCLAPNIIPLIFAGIICFIILAKFLAALQLTGKRHPEMLDKFIICQVPCYTEGEESLRRTIDSLAGLRYDDKRKLIFLICDGNIIGSGNDRPTPRIVLDILGVDPKLDPEPLMFKSVAEGSKQINYGKIYSGLYEFEGHVVPYVVVVKVGKPSERSKPGNRGKRDSQILLLHYLNRVHFDAPMSPMELEIYHQMRNVIGIDPAFYEYIFMVDADTSVTPDSLNRLVACTADDSKIIAICGETKLDNEEGSWWTMVQVYEYYVSHHLAKAFESLFGSVTCLPGCFSMYRIRTADKGRPLIISSRVIDDYSEGIVDTLHKKNLLHLGEDRYLTTIMMKHFPTFKMKFTPDAIAHTVAPDKFDILLSQRRRWINSTVHNLCELVFLSDLCGFCCFSMRFVVFIDLVGTIVLPATVIYIVWLIVHVATTNAPIPWIAIGMIGGVYALQAIIFLLKREFMLIGWMVIYILAYPIWSFFLPVYAFWRMDDFSWGNTRLVVGEGANKKVIMDDDEKFDESMIPLKKFSEYEAEAWETGSRHSGEHTYDASHKTRSRRPSRSGNASPVSFHPASQSGDFYRDTNALGKSGGASPRARSVRGDQAQSTMSQFGMGPPQLGPVGSMGAMGMNPFGTMHQMGSMGFLPYMGGSHAGSDYGGMMQPQMTGMTGMGPMAAGSMYGGGMAVPRNSVMTNLNMFGGPGSVAGGPAPSVAGMGGMARPLSTFSVDPFGGTGPSPSDNPSDEELLAVLRHYLSTQDLMTVTKKTARAAVEAKFPRADLSGRKDFLNQSIDAILSSS